LANLTIVLLSGTGVRDLAPLIELKNLNFLDIRKTPVHEGQVAALKKALPNLEVLES
jgi:hypothetical protein